MKMLVKDSHQLNTLGAPIIPCASPQVAAQGTNGLSKVPSYATIEHKSRNMGLGGSQKRSTLKGVIGVKSHK